MCDNGVDMGDTHAITGSPRTYAHTAVLVLLTVLYTLLVPYAGDTFADLLKEHAVHLGILFAIVVAFVMTITLERRKGIDEAVAIELNKVRRIYHLAMHLAKVGGPETKKWFRGLEREIAAYHAVFRDKDFAEYATGNAQFRRITYAIYGLPALTDAYNTDLYLGLLEAAGSATEAREHIRAKLDAGIGRFQWFTILFITLLFGTIIAAVGVQEPLTRLASASVNIALVLMLQLVYEHDHFNPRKRRILADLYVRNWDLIKNPS